MGLAVAVNHQNHARLIVVVERSFVAMASAITAKHVHLATEIVALALVRAFAETAPVTTVKLQPLAQRIANNHSDIVMGESFK